VDGLRPLEYLVAFAFRNFTQRPRNTGLHLRAASQWRWASSQGKILGCDGMQAIACLYRRGYLDLQVPSRAVDEVEQYISHRLSTLGVSMFAPGPPPALQTVDAATTWNLRITVCKLCKPTDLLLRQRARRRTAARLWLETQRPLACAHDCARGAVVSRDRRWTPLWAGSNSGCAA
jgi:hypothetical protein